MFCCFLVFILGLWGFAKAHKVASRKFRREMRVVVCLSSGYEFLLLLDVRSFSVTNSIKLLV